MRGVIFGVRAGAAIRTYNYQRGTVKDHRSGVVANLKKVLDGDLDCLIIPMREKVAKESLCQTK